MPVVFKADGVKAFVLVCVWYEDRAVSRLMKKKKRKEKKHLTVHTTPKNPLNLYMCTYLFSMHFTCTYHGNECHGIFLFSEWNDCTSYSVSHFFCISKGQKWTYMLKYIDTLPGLFG